MTIGIVVNVVGSDEGGQTTYRIAAACARRGHTVHVISTGNFAYSPHGAIEAQARSAPRSSWKTSQAYAAALKSKASRTRRITVDDLDILLLRSNPAVQTPWAQHAGIHFGRLAAERGVLVLNDPNGLFRAINKLYLQNFPEAVRPRTLVTRSRKRLRAFVDEEGTAVLKPLQGSGGRGVFVVRAGDGENLDGIVSAVSRDGYVVAQEYLPAAEAGDTRLFLLNGVPLVHRGRTAAFRRARSGEDMRSNIHAGGKLRRASLGDAALRLADMVRPNVVRDGMFLVGLDIVGDKLMEINVFSPGGLGSAQLFEKVDFTETVVDALERKVNYVKHYRRNFSNPDMATL